MNARPDDRSLVCPVTRQPVRVVALAEARGCIAGGAPLASRVGSESAVAFGETAEMLLRADERVAYPIVRGVPILLGPEVLADPRHRPAFDLDASQYAEAYLEMTFYNALAERTVRELAAHGDLRSSGSEGFAQLAVLLEQLATTAPEELGERFPHPWRRWLAARMDLASEWDCYTHLAPVRGRRIVQIGGSGSAVIRLLLAGAAEGILVTPMLGEALLAREVARILGVCERLRCVVGVGEEIPLADASVDAAFSGGCIHHMTTSIAFPEIARILRPEGRFAALEPWRAPLYALGTRLLGKREANPFCRPMTAERVAPLFSSFRAARHVQHGTLSRYAMLGAEKLGAEKLGASISFEAAWRISRWDDRFCSLIPGLRSFGSGVALLATK